MGDSSEPSRRDWLRLVGTGAATVAIAGCDDPPPATDAAAAILETTSDGFLVAVWTRHARTAKVEIRTAGTGSVHTLALAGSGSAALEVTGLTPGTDHEVIVATADGLRLGPHHVRTAPRDDDTAPIRIAVAADLDPDYEVETDIIDHLIEAVPELLVTLGDFPYTDNGPPAQTVETYRERHLALRTMPRVRALLEAMPLRSIYDDHEFRNDWDASFVEAEPERYGAAMTVWDEFFPVREAGPDVRYRRWRHGANVECFLLDCRRFRSANAALDGPGKTMLGMTQLRWFLDGIAQSTATFKLVFTSVPLDFADGNDAWHAFATERQLVYEGVIGIPGVLFVSADQHWFAAHRHAFGIREFQIGPLQRGVGVPGRSGPGVVFRSERYNVALIDIASDQLTLTGLGQLGTRFYTETFTPEQLTARRGGTAPG